MHKHVLELVMLRSKVRIVDRCSNDRSRRSRLARCTRALLACGCARTRAPSTTRASCRTPRRVDAASHRRRRSLVRLRLGLRTPLPARVRAIGTRRGSCRARAPPIGRRRPAEARRSRRRRRRRRALAVWLTGTGARTTIARVRAPLGASLSVSSLCRRSTARAASCTHRRSSRASLAPRSPRSASYALPDT